MTRGLAAVGHLGWDVALSARGESRSLGGSLMHFLTGISFTHQHTTAYTWTDSVVARLAADRLPPWIEIANAEVPVAPTFTIEYVGEQISRFEISNIDLPPEVPETSVPDQDLHFSAMPLHDIRRLLFAWQPSTWSMQLHEAVLPEELDVDEETPAPSTVFCNSSEWERIERRGKFADPRTAWVITDRDRVRIQRGSSGAATFQFNPLERVVETTGAGDVLAGATLGALRQGVALEAAVRFGVGVAAVSLFEPSSESFASWWT